MTSRFIFYKNKIRKYIKNITDIKINLMAEESNKFSGKGCLVIVTLILFMINTIKFINNPASEVPVFSILFNMILYLGIIIFILHKKEVSLDKYILS